MAAVLLIAPFFPPRRRVGALRAFRFATHLGDLGWRPAVVCLATPGASLTEREAARLTDVARLELAVGFDTTRGRSGSDLERARNDAGSGRAGRRAAVPLRRALLGLRDGVDRWLPVDGWLPVLWAHARRVAAFAREHQVSAIWSTADPWSSHLLAGHVARRLGLPWIADFRDPWTLCRRRLANRPAPMLALDRRVERRIVRSADRLVFTAARTTERYREAYPASADRMETIYNGFDSALFSTSLDDELDARPGGSDRLEVLFFGKFRALSPARPIIEALAALRERFPGSAAGIRIQSMGALEPADAELARSMGVTPMFEQVPSVPFEEALKRLRKADVLLLSTDPARDEIVPAKLWDYLAARRPILSLAPNPEVGRILEEVGAGRHVGSGREGTIRAATALSEAYEAKRRGDAIWPELPFRTERLPEFDAPSTTARLVRLLEEVTHR